MGTRVFLEDQAVQGAWNRADESLKEVYRLYNQLWIPIYRYLPDEGIDGYAPERLAVDFIHASEAKLDECIARDKTHKLANYAEVIDYVKEHNKNDELTTLLEQFETAASSLVIYSIYAYTPDEKYTDIGDRVTEESNAFLENFYTTYVEPFGGYYAAAVANLIRAGYLGVTAGGTNNPIRAIASMARSGIYADNSDVGKTLYGGGGIHTGDGTSSHVEVLRSSSEVNDLTSATCRFAIPLINPSIQGMFGSVEKDTAPSYYDAIKCITDVLRKCQVDIVVNVDKNNVSSIKSGVDELTSKLNELVTTKSIEEIIDLRRRMIAELSAVMYGDEESVNEVSKLYSNVMGRVLCLKKNAKDYTGPGADVIGNAGPVSPMRALVKDRMGATTGQISEFSELMRLGADTTKYYDVVDTNDGYAVHVLDNDGKVIDTVPVQEAAGYVYPKLMPIQDSGTDNNNFNYCVLTGIIFYTVEDYGVARDRRTIDEDTRANVGNNFGLDHYRLSPTPSIDSVEKSRVAKMSLDARRKALADTTGFNKSNIDAFNSAGELAMIADGGKYADSTDNMKSIVAFGAALTTVPDIKQILEYFDKIDRSIVKLGDELRVMMGSNYDLMFRGKVDNARIKLSVYDLQGDTVNYQHFFGELANALMMPADKCISRIAVKIGKSFDFMAYDETDYGGKAHDKREYISECIRGTETGKNSILNSNEIGFCSHAIRLCDFVINAITQIDTYFGNINQDFLDEFINVVDGVNADGSPASDILGTMFLRQVFNKCRVCISYAYAFDSNRDNEIAEISSGTLGNSSVDTADTAEIASKHGNLNAVRGERAGLHSNIDEDDLSLGFAEENDEGAYKIGTISTNKVNISNTDDDGISSSDYHSVSSIINVANEVVEETSDGDAKSHAINMHNDIISVERVISLLGSLIEYDDMKVEQTVDEFLAYLSTRAMNRFTGKVKYAIDAGINMIAQANRDFKRNIHLHAVHVRTAACKAILAIHNASGEKTIDDSMNSIGTYLNQILLIGEHSPALIELLKMYCDNTEYASDAVAKTDEAKSERMEFKRALLSELDRDSFNSDNIARINDKLQKFTRYNGKGNAYAQLKAKTIDGRSAKRMNNGDYALLKKISSSNLESFLLQSIITDESKSRSYEDTENIINAILNGSAFKAGRTTLSRNGVPETARLNDDEYYAVDKSCNVSVVGKHGKGSPMSISDLADYLGVNQPEPVDSVDELISRLKVKAVDKMFNNNFTGAGKITSKSPEFKEYKNEFINNVASGKVKLYQALMGHYANFVGTGMALQYASPEVREDVFGDRVYGVNVNRSVSPEKNAFFAASVYDIMKRLPAEENLDAYGKVATKLSDIGAASMSPETGCPLIDRFYASSANTLAERILTAMFDDNAKAKRILGDDSIIHAIQNGDASGLTEYQRDIYNYMRSHKVNITTAHSDLDKSVNPFRYPDAKASRIIGMRDRSITKMNETFTEDPAQIRVDMGDEYPAVINWMKSMGIISQGAGRGTSIMFNIDDNILSYNDVIYLIDTVMGKLGIKNMSDFKKCTSDSVMRKHIADLIKTLADDTPETKKTTTDETEVKSQANVAEPVNA